MSLAIPGIPPEVIPLGIITNICTDEPRNADIRMISVSLMIFPIFVFGVLDIICIMPLAPSRPDRGSFRTVLPGDIPEC